MKYTIIITEEIPEESNIYFVPSSEIDDDTRKYLDELNGKAIGCDDVSDDAINIRTALFVKDEHKQYVDGNVPIKFLQKFTKYQQSLSGCHVITPANCEVEKVYSTMFLL